MKKSIWMLLFVMVLGAFCTGVTVYADETETSGENLLEYKAQGYTVNDPDNWEGLKGSLLIYPASSAALNENPDLYASYLYYLPVKSEEIESEEEAMAALAKMTSAGYLFTIGGNRDQLLDAMDDLWLEKKYDDETIESNLFQVGEADGFQFFVLITPDEEYVASLDEEYVEDYNNLPALLTEELGQMEFYAPIDPIKTMEGKTLSFTATDLDGNTLTSEELFKDNEITMVNMWGVWCHNCVDEMEELAAINTRLQEKGCGIIGIEWEQTPTEEVYQQARDLMEEKGTNYPSVLMPEDNEILGEITSFPTTLFVDREGRILTKPIIGARVAEYEPTLESLLDGSSVSESGSGDAEEDNAADSESGTEEAEEDSASDSESGTEEAEEDSASVSESGTAKAEGSYTYRVFVKDEEDQPLEKVSIQFCDDTACRMGKTDVDGCAVFEVPVEQSYEVHVLKAPEGYAYDSEEVFHTDEVSSDMTIVLKKAE